MESRKRRLLINWWGGLSFGYVMLVDLGIFMFLAFHRLHAHVSIVYGADIISLVFRLRFYTIRFCFPMPFGRSPSRSDRD